MKSVIETLWFCYSVVMPIVIAVGLVEVYNDTNPPGWFWAKAGDEWGKTKFTNPYWEQEVEVPLLFIKYISRYHLVMFGRIVPIFMMLRVAEISSLTRYEVFPAGMPWYTSLLSAIILFAAMQTAVMGVEDFFYFAVQSCFNWLEPHALRRVLHGDFAWFKDWIPLPFGIKVPGHWIFLPGVSIALLYIRQRWMMQ